MTQTLKLQRAESRAPPLKALGARLGAAVHGFLLSNAARLCKLSNPAELGNLGTAQ